MSISIPGADYTPQLVGYTGQGAFRFWCQKVLPIVYDDSLSYYELLNKVVNYLNNVIADVASVEKNIGMLNDSYSLLQAYVNEHMQEIVDVVNEYTEFTTNYFTNLDVQEEINTKLDEMASNGSLSQLIGPIVAATAPDIITQWMDDHITPTTPIVDDTLTISGAAADAKVVGDIIADDYSENSNYSIGDYALYNGKLYVCKYGIYGGEVWDSTHWRLVNVGAELSYSNNALEANEINQGYVFIYKGATKASASSSWPEREFNGNIIKINGNFATTAVNYYTPLDNPTSTTTSTSGLNEKPKNISLEYGHYYQFSGYVLSGTVYTPAGTSLTYKAKNSSNNVVFECGYNETKIFRWNETGNALFYLNAQNDQGFANAVLAYVLIDVTEQIEESVELSYLGSALEADEINQGYVFIYKNLAKLSASTSWPEREFNRNVIRINGSFSDAAVNYYTPLDDPGNITTGTAGLNGKPKNISLEYGHYYKFSGYLLSGSVTVPDGTSLTYKAKNSNNTVIFECNYNETKTFRWYERENAIFYLNAQNNQSFESAVLAYVLVDITEQIEAVMAPNETGVTFQSLKGYGWVNGRHSVRGATIDSPQEVLNTITTTVPLYYDWNTKLHLKDDSYTLAFVSFEEDETTNTIVCTGVSKAFEQFPEEISMLDIFNNLAYATASYFGNMYAIMIRKADSSNISANNIDIDSIIEIERINTKANVTKKGKWVAIGDSITDGRYSQSDGTVRTKTNHYCQYGYIASTILNFSEYIEQGYGGMGYVHVANDGTTLADVLDMDFGAPDVITVNLGVNDRSKTLGDENSLANDGTISGAVRYCAETLGDKYKNAQIIFMTPINCTASGSLSTGWAKNAGTTHLSDIADIIKYWAKKYGFPVIDMLNECPVNDFNITELILDELHPTMEAHYLISNFVAGEMPVKL